MPLSAYLLVLVSALAHASWNVLLKKSHDKEIFIWLAQLFMCLLFSPLFILIIRYQGIESSGWMYIIGTSVLHAFYFIFLSRSYEHGDVSEVYPIARGTGPAIVPILGIVVFDEIVSLPAAAGIIFVCIGIFGIYRSSLLSNVLSNPLKIVKNKSVAYSLLTGITIAAYSICDKKGVEYVHPLAYMYLMMAGSSGLLTPFIFARKQISDIQVEIRANWRTICTVGVLTFAAYSMVLFALEIGKLSYVWPVREVSIIIAVFLGRIFLHEKLESIRIAGACAIVAGVILIGVSA